MTADETPDSARRVGRILDEAWRRHTDERLDRLEKTVGELGQAVGKSSGKDDGDPCAPFWWGDLDETEQAKRWAELEAWVAHTLAPTWPDTARLLPDCWAKHPGAVAAVTAAWLAWRGAYVAKTRRPDDPARFLRDVLPALRRQLDGEFSPTGLTTAPTCSARH